MNIFLRHLLFFAVFHALAAPAHAGIVGKISAEAIELAVDKAAKVTGKGMASDAARKTATAEVRRLANTHGQDVLKVVEDGGLELLEAVPKHGNDLIKVAMKASPQARRALALNADEMLPLARRVGTEALELEAKVPGQAAKAFQVFGDDAGKSLAKSIPTEDLPRLIKYGEKADNEGTRKLLLSQYSQEGAKLFLRIPPQLVLAGGLSASMLLGTHEMTAETRAKADVLREHPEIARDVMNRSTIASAVIAVIVVLILLWRFGLMPWHRSHHRRQ
jgi:hypothetical protein